jgi:hypothetical protein
VTIAVEIIDYVPYFIWQGSRVTEQSLLQIPPQAITHFAHGHRYAAVSKVEDN